METLGIEINTLVMGYVAIVLLTIVMFLICPKDSLLNSEIKNAKREINRTPFTLGQVRKFDGVQKPQTYVVVCNQVFDVTGQATFMRGGAY